MSSPKTIWSPRPQSPSPSPATPGDPQRTRTTGRSGFPRFPPGRTSPPSCSRCRRRWEATSQGHRAALRRTMLERPTGNLGQPPKSPPPPSPTSPPREQTTPTPDSPLARPPPQKPWPHPQQPPAPGPAPPPGPVGGSQRGQPRTWRCPAGKTGPAGHSHRGRRTTGCRSTARAGPTPAVAQPRSTQTDAQGPPTPQTPCCSCRSQSQPPASPCPPRWPRPGRWERCRWRPWP
mmetsp:Transcript_8128/g.20040  ORF Transcript_8128/g.20040 Transcript_8128/m.20040 type:complete len:233 (-) Transcript_8128:834-1532(-)